jgi:hypothetical protein
MSVDDAQLISQLESLPNCLRYGAKQLQIRIARNTNLLPINNDSVSGNGTGTVRFRFPSASIINLSSATVSFISTITGLVVGSGGASGVNFVNATFPASYKYIRRVQFFLGGISVAGGLCNQYSQIYHAMVRAVGNNEFCNTKVLEGFTELTGGYDASNIFLVQPPLATSKSTYQQIDDFLLLAKGNGGCNEMMVDTSIWNDLEMQIDFEGPQVLSVYVDGSASGANVAWALSQLRLNVDCVSSIPPIYSSFLAVRSQRPEPIRLVFQNLVSQIQQVSGSNRLQVSSMCIDGILVAPLGSGYQTYTPFTGNVAANAFTLDITNNPYFDFNSGLDNTTQAQWTGLVQVGTSQYPTTQYNNLYLTADSTLNHYWSNSMAATSLLFLDVTANVSQTSASSDVEQSKYIPLNFLTHNTIWVQSFSLEDGWNNPNKILSGIDTSSTNVEIVVIQSGISNSRYFLMVGLLSSVIEFDTIARRIRVIQ